MEKIVVSFNNKSVEQGEWIIEKHVLPLEDIIKSFNIKYSKFKLEKDKNNRYYFKYNDKDKYEINKNQGMLF